MMEERNTWKFSASLNLNSAVNAMTAADGASLDEATVMLLNASVLCSMATAQAMLAVAQELRGMRMDRVI